MIGNKKTSEELNSLYNHLTKNIQTPILNDLSKPAKNKGKTLFITQSDFDKNSKMILSPSIFVEKKSYFKKNRANRKALKVFEQLLSVVVSSYYSSDYTLNIVLKNVKSNPENNSEENDKVLNGKSQKANGVSKNVKKKGKGRPRNKKDNSPEYEEGNVLDYLLSPLKQDQQFGSLIRKLDC